MVEISKALSFDSKVLIMDEPTAALTDTEIDALFVMIRKLRQDGVGIVYISHRMEELKKITDRVSIMRDGTYVGTMNTKDATIEQIISMMVGRKLITIKTRNERENERKVFEVKNLKRGNVIKDVSFELYKGKSLALLD